MLKVYEFTIMLRGRGYDENEAWLNAVELLADDPGIPDIAEIVEE